MKGLLHFALNKFGYQIVRIESRPRPSDELAPFFVLLRRFGFAPKHILDVGANRGFWTREALKVFPNARYTLVEPQDHLRSHVQDLVDGSRIQWINAGVSDSPGSLPFTITRADSSCTFALSEEQARNASLQQVVLPVRTLDEIVRSLGGDLPDLVKIDAEGLDLKVLAGASTLLGRSDVFLVEALVCAGGYENSTIKVLHFMADAGYRLVDITDLNRSPRHGVLWLCELAFLRKDCPLLDAASTYD